MSDCRNCTEANARLAPYVDGTLPPGERDAVERHLHDCPPCKEEALDEAAGRRLLRDGAPRLRTTEVPPEFRTRCQALAHAQCTRGAKWRSSAVLLGCAAGLILATAAAIAYVATQRSNTVLAAQLARDHAGCFGDLRTSGGLVDARSIEQMFESRYGLDVHVPPSSPADDMQLLEGRRCLLMHGGAPHLLYRVNGQDVSLYVFEGVSRPDGDVTVFGSRTIVWSRGANSFALVASATSDVSRAVAYVRAEAH